MSAKLIQVIEVDEHEGRGIPGDPARIVVRYYSTDGQLLAERDSWLQMEERRKQSGVPLD